MREDTPGEAPSGISGERENQFFAATAADRRKARKLELGYIGRFLGGGTEKTGNIAALTIAACMIAMAFIALRVDWSKDGDTAIKAMAGISSIVTLALGYLFGVHHSPSSEGSSK